MEVFMQTLRHVILSVLLGCMLTTVGGEKARAVITDFGAVGDGKTVNTEAIAKALDHLKTAGGGELVIPKGEFISGKIILIDNLTIRLEDGAVLKASPDIKDHLYIKYYTPFLNFHFIYGKNIKNLHITGPGTLDGNGRGYWQDVYINGTPFEKMKQRPIYYSDVLRPKSERPVLLFLDGCTDIRMDNLKVSNSAAFTLWFVGCRRVKLDNIFIRNLRYGPNTDAIDIDCTSDVEISNCDIEAGDDCIAIKSDPYRTNTDVPSENIYVHDCKFSAETCAIRIGYEGDAPIRNVKFKNIYVRDTRHGIDILSIVPKSNVRVKYGTPIENLHFDNFTMEEVGQAFFIWAGNEPGKTGHTGYIRNLVAENMNITSLGTSFIGGEKEGIIGPVVLRNIKMHVANPPGMPATKKFAAMPSHWGDWWKSGGLRVLRADVKMENCNITCDHKGFEAIEIMK